ncbi:MAG TPA: hypothetical protein PKL08_11825, partial [Thermoanaerobaculaceae bacterium]|nr:hypothetical protein [Thermoanaerobaculaceae bacterium]
MTSTGVVRWGLRGLGALVILVLAWLLFGRIYTVRRLDAAKEAFKRDLGSLELSAWAPPSVPDEQNAAIPIRSGALGLVFSEADVKLRGELTRNPTDPMTAEQIAGLRRMLETNKTALEAIARGTRLQRSNFGTELRIETPQLGADGKPHLGALGQDLIGVMNAARILWAKARLERVDGDREQMLATNETVFRLAGAVYREPQLISQLISNAVERIGLGAVVGFSVAPDATPEEFRRMQAMLLTNDLRTLWRRAVAVETLTLMAGVKRVTAEPATGSASSPWGRALHAVWGPVPETVQLELCAELARLIDQPAALRGPAPEVPRGIDGLRMYLWGYVNPFPVTKLVYRKMVLETSLSSSGRLQATMSQRRLVGLVLALRLQGMASGTYPQDLSGFP